jgi:hypothetical protein
VGHYEEVQWQPKVVDGARRAYRQRGLYRAYVPDALGHTPLALPYNRPGVAMPSSPIPSRSVWLVSRQISSRFSITAGLGALSTGHCS